MGIGGDFGHSITWWFTLHAAKFFGRKLANETYMGMATGIKSRQIFNPLRNVFFMIKCTRKVIEDWLNHIPWCPNTQVSFHEQKIFGGVAMETRKSKMVARPLKSLPTHSLCPNSIMPVVTIYNILTILALLVICGRISHKLSQKHLPMPN
jgi:hypothetical protein